MSDNWEQFILLVACLIVLFFGLAIVSTFDGLAKIVGVAMIIGGFVGGIKALR